MSLTHAFLLLVTHKMSLTHSLMVMSVVARRRMVISFEDDNFKDGNLFEERLAT